MERKVQSQDFERFRQSIKESAKDVKRERMKRIHFPVVIERLKEYWR